MRIFLTITLWLGQVYLYGQRTNIHMHAVDIEKIMLLDYLLHLDTTAKIKMDTILIPYNLDIKKFENINVKHVLSIFEYVKNSEESLIIINSEQHFENDSTIFVTKSLRQVRPVKKRSLFKKEPSLIITETDYQRQFEKDYYVKLDRTKSKWEIIHFPHLDFAYKNDKDWILMDSTNARQLINELILTHDLKQYINSITTEGQVTDWLTEDDLKYLISLVDSKIKAKCLVRSISSQRLCSEDICTIGNHAIHILDCFINNRAYPDQLNICPNYSNDKKNEILKWWKDRKN